MTGPRLSIIPARAATDRNLKPRDLQVLCVLGRHTDDLGWCRKSQVKMAEEMGCARSTVFEAVERLVKAGYLERHVQEEQNGRDSPHVYRVILDPVHPAVETVKEADDACQRTGTPAGISAPPAGSEPAPPAGPGPAPKNDPLRTTDSERIERERASADEREGKDTGSAGKGDRPSGQMARPAGAAGGEAADAPREAEKTDETADAEERPETAAFQKRVMRFANGRGFAAGPWPDWDTSSPGHIARCFAKLSIGERAEAESWRDAYLLDIAARKKRPVPVANFLRDRLWTGLEPALLARADKARAAKLSPDDQARPDGWEKLLGPVGMALLFGKLLAGPDDQAAAARPFMTEPVLRQAWPAVWWWQAVQRQKGGTVVGPVWHALKDAMEPVPQGTPVLAEWRSFFDAKGWPWLNVFDRTEVVYCPKGGPGGLEAFERAMREAEEKGGGYEHGNRSQAAE